MDVILERCAGLDVHQATVAACLRLPGPGRTRTQVVQTLGTLTPDLLALRDWLTAHQVTHVAMESTGVYWKPIYSVLEDAFTLLLVNAAHLAKVPGRKTDVADCVWIAQLLECGLLRGSFVPPRRSGSSGTSHGTGRPSCRIGPGRPTGSTRSCRMPGSSSPPWPPTSWASRAGRCSRPW